MHKIAIWSFSKHFQNKVLPSIKNNKQIQIKYILTKQNHRDIGLKNIKWLGSKEELKSKQDIDFVYISSINTNHFKNIKFALLHKFNVICEKPICLKTNQFRELIKISKLKKVKFFEMIQYKHHPVFFKLKEILTENLIGKVKQVDVGFKIPLKDKNNFRFKKELGGGAIYDVGFYPISIMFTLFNTKKIKIIETKFKKENKLDVKGSLSAVNENEILFKLSWGFKSLYKNFLRISGTKGKIEIKFIFSKKISQGAKIILNTSKKKVIHIKKANQINLAFKDILKSNRTDFIKELDLSFQIFKIINLLNKKIN